MMRQPSLPGGAVVIDRNAVRTRTVISRARPWGVVLPLVLLVTVGWHRSSDVGRRLDRPVTRDGASVQDPTCAGGQSTMAPCTGATDTVITSGTGQVTFTIANAGTSDHSYTTSCAYTDPLTTCNTAPSAVVVPAGGTSSVTVAYTVAATQGAATVSVTADGGAPDQVTATATVYVVTAPQ
jgi:hypothetical protein